MKGGVVKWRRLCVLHFACTYAPPLLVLVRDKRGLKERGPLWAVAGMDAMRDRVQGILWGSEHADLTVTLCGEWRRERGRVRESTLARRRGTAPRAPPLCLYVKSVCEREFGQRKRKPLCSPHTPIECMFSLSASVDAPVRAA